MSKRNRREHGRIISVETKARGDALADDVAAGVTSITVEDAGDFDEDGGWLLIGGQVVEFTECDDDTGIITLADPLDAAAEQGDPVQVWSELYEEVVDYQQALVELDGEYDNPDPVVAEVAEGVGSLPEGDRGRGGESCTLHRVSEDEWEVVGVGGRGRQSQGVRFEQDDAYTLTAADIAAGSATMTLSHRPNDEALTCYLASIPQRPSEWSVDYDGQTLTIPLDGWEKAGFVAWVHYAYSRGVQAAPAAGGAILVDWASGGWKYQQFAISDTTDRSAPGFDDSAWATGVAPFGDEPVNHPYPDPFGATTTVWADETSLWLRRSITVPTGLTSVTFSIRIDNLIDVYVDGTLVGSRGPTSTSSPNVADITVSVAAGTRTIAVRAQDSAGGGSSDATYFDMQIRAEAP